MLFASFYRRNLAFARLAIVTNLEYRLNFVTDALVQPVASAIVEVLLWYSLFQIGSGDLLAGFPRENYLAYALWASFLTRITTNWMYEARMMNEIESGTLNSILVRPISFFEYYLSQFLGYKVLIIVVSLAIPLIATKIFALPFLIARLPTALALIVWYLVFCHLLSYTLSCVAFHMTKTHSLSMAKNLALWLLSGELIPLDMLPPGAQEIFLLLPFASAVYVPTAYLIGRVNEDILVQGFVATTLGIGVCALLAQWAWRRGLRAYSGTGA